MTDKPKSTFARRVRAARPRARKYEISDDAILGLTLRVFPSGARTFSLSRRVRGRRRQPHDRARGAQAHRQLHRASEKGQRPHDPGATDGRLRRRVPRTPGPPLEAPHAGVQHLHGAQVHPAYLRTHDRGRYRRRTRQGLVRLHGRPARCRQPFHAGPVRHDAHGRALGIPPHNSNPCKRTRRYRMKPKERFLTADEMARLNAVLARDEFYCPHIVAIIRLLMLTGCRLGEVVSLEWDWIRAMRIHLPDSEVRAAHGLAVERRARGHRRHPAVQRRLPLPVSRPSRDAPHYRFRVPMAPHPQRGGSARLADS